jgi:hypothetical protein
MPVKLIRDLGNAVVVQVNDQVKVLPKKGEIFRLLEALISTPKPKGSSSN